MRNSIKVFIQTETPWKNTMKYLNTGFHILVMHCGSERVSGNVPARPSVRLLSHHHRQERRYRAPPELLQTACWCTCPRRGMGPPALPCARHRTGPEELVNKWKMSSKLMSKAALLGVCSKAEVPETPDDLCVSVSVWERKRESVWS